jgi:PhzF family phenazine biosynthesis protein
LADRGSTFEGNQVAIVKISNGLQLSHDQKQRIAAKLNFSETVFLYCCGAKAPRIEIFTPVNEMKFAGHSTIGTGHLLF